MNLNTGKEVFSEVLQVEEKNRPWAREVIVIFLALAFSVATFFVFQAQKSEAIRRAIKAESKLEALQLLYVNEGKECPKLIREAEKNKDLEYKLEIANIRDNYNKELKTKADKLEQDLNRIRKKLGQ